jgi:hypothetical protein
MLAGTRIKFEQTRLEWTPEAEEAIHDRQMPVDLCTRDPIRRDSVILQSDLVKCPKPAADGK